MEFTISDLIDINRVLFSIQDRPNCFLKTAVALQLNSLGYLSQPTLERYDTKWKDLLAQYGVQQSDDPNKYNVPENNKTAFEEAVNKLTADTVEIAFEKIPMQEFANLQLSLKEAQILTKIAK